MMSRGGASRIIADRVRVVLPLPEISPCRLTVNCLWGYAMQLANDCTCSMGNSASCCYHLPSCAVSESQFEVHIPTF